MYFSRYWRNSSGGKYEITTPARELALGDLRLSQEPPMFSTTTEGHEGKRVFKGADTPMRVVEGTCSGLSWKCTFSVVSTFSVSPILLCQIEDNGLVWQGLNFRVFIKRTICFVLYHLLGYVNGLQSPICRSCPHSNYRDVCRMDT